MRLGVKTLDAGGFLDGKPLPRPRSGELLILNPPTPRHPASSGFSLPGYQSGWSIEAAARLALARKVDAIVTGPISKARLQAGGFDFPGHTEMLARACRRRRVTMMLANSQLRVTLVTTHLALKAVSSSLTGAAISTTIRHTVDSLRAWWGIDHPRVAVAALNPHAGEGGLFGHEEDRLIGPAVKRLQRRYRDTATLEGPLPADTLFARHLSAPASERFDAVVCMYHDQGLIPVKMIDFPNTVNITLGLPLIRTSVDHGVAFDIAGRGLADPSSFKSAFRLACDMVKNRRENRS